MIVVFDGSFAKVHTNKKVLMEVKMAEYSYIKASFWTDPDNEDLTPGEKLVFLYIITNGKRTQSGIYEVSDRRISFDTSLPEEEIPLIKKKLSESGMIKYDENLIWVVNFLKHQANSSPTVKTRIAKDLLPYMNHPFFQEFREKYHTLSIPYLDRIDTCSIKKRKEKEKKEEVKEKEEEEKESLKDNILDITKKPKGYIISYLNEKTGSSFRTNSQSTIKLLNGRFKEGYTEKDIIAVIDLKCKQWLRDLKMKVYLRPETLFSPSKFESYINEVKAKDKTRGKYDGVGEVSKDPTGGNT